MTTRDRTLARPNLLPISYNLNQTFYRKSVTHVLLQPLHLQTKVFPGTQCSGSTAHSCKWYCMAPCLHRQSNSLLERTRGTLWLRCTRRLGHWRVVGGTRLRLILIIGHNLTVSLYSFFEFLADVAGRLLRHGASFEKEDRECQTDCAKTSHPHQFSVLSPKYEVFCCDQNGPPARRSEPDWR